MDLTKVFLVITEALNLKDPDLKRVFSPSSVLWWLEGFP
jgi:hypothetical protein